MRETERTLYCMNMYIHTYVYIGTLYQSLDTSDCSKILWLRSAEKVA